MNMREENGREAALKWSTWKGLLWWDLRRHRSEFLVGLPTIVVMALVFGMGEDMGGPMFLFAGLAMAVAAGLSFGRSEWRLGYEEYSLGLPPARRDRFFVRLALGVVFLGVLLVAGLASGPLGWARALGEHVMGGDLTFELRGKLWPEFQGVGFFVMSIGLGAAVFVESFAVSINVERGLRPNWALLFAPFVVVALAVVAIDRQLFPADAGSMTGLLAFIWAIVRAQLGARRFESKDVVLDLGASVERSAACRSKQRAANRLVLVVLTLLAGVGSYLLVANQ